MHVRCWDVVKIKTRAVYRLVKNVWKIIYERRENREQRLSETSGTQDAVEWQLKNSNTSVKKTQKNNNNNSFHNAVA